MIKTKRKLTTLSNSNCYKSFNIVPAKLPKNLIIIARKETDLSHVNNPRNPNHDSNQQSSSKQKSEPADVDQDLVYIGANKETLVENIPYFEAAFREGSNWADSENNENENSEEPWSLPTFKISVRNPEILAKY